MRRCVNDHVLRRQHAQTVLEGQALRDQFFCIRMWTSGQRQNRVMHVDHPIAIAVDQGGQLMHPTAIIGIVISVRLYPLPPCLEQRRLDIN